MSDSYAPNHDDWADSVASYALGALPESEVAGFEQHLAACGACRVELEELTAAVAALPAMVPPRAAPAHLRERIMRDVRREADLLHAAGPEADRPQRPQRSRRRRFGWAPRWTIAVALGALAAGFAIGMLAGGGDGPGAVDRTVRMAAAGPAEGARAEIVMDGGHATLDAEDLPAPPDGRVYQVWLEKEGDAPEPTPSLFVPRADGTALVAVPDAAADADIVMVSSEPAGGSPAPTTAPILTAAMRD